MSHPSSIVDLTTATPIEIDTQLAEIWGRFYESYYQVERAAQQLKYLRADNYRACQRGTEAEIDAAEDRVQAARDAANLILVETLPFNVEFDRRGGWTRAYLVDNTGGHVHSSRNCSSCFPLTRFHWVTELSGSDESAIIEAAGETACTLCYPSAPVDVLSRPTTIDSPRRRAQAEVAAEKAARAVAKAAKAISNSNGTSLYGNYGILATERAAQIELVDLIVSHKLYGYQEHFQTQQRIVAALAHKRNQTTDQVWAEIAPKVAAKIKREGRG